MKHVGAFLAAGLVLAANVFVLVRVARNRSGSPPAAVELTERELRLVRPFRESTALFLELTWQPAWRGLTFENGPGWFDRAKLEELGYDCRLPVTDPSAPEHYRMMSAREAFAVLQYKEAASTDGGEGRLTMSRLVAVDAGRDPALLRSKYPDAQRFLIVPSLVRLLYQVKWDPNTRRYLPDAYLCGSVVQMQVNQIAVPPSQRGVFEALGKSSYEFFGTPEGRARGPRYSAILYYGNHHEPWIGACHLIPTTSR